MVILYLSVSYSKDKDTPPYTTTMNIRNPCSFVHLLHPYYLPTLLYSHIGIYSSATVMRNIRYGNNGKRTFR